MRIAFAVLIGLHGLIHLLGPTKAFGWAEVRRLRTPITPLGGALWLVAAVLLVGAAAGIALGARSLVVVARPAGRAAVAGADRAVVERREVRHARERGDRDPARAPPAGRPAVQLPLAVRARPRRAARAP